MKSLSHHINTVKAQPHHIRKQVAFTAAFVVAVVIGIVWLGASLATGVFALKQTSFAQSTGAEASPAVATTQSNAGLAAAAAAAGVPPSQPAGIEIVDGTGNSQTSAAPASQPTVIPF